MTHKALSKWMKIIIIMFGLFGAVIFAYIVPSVCADASARYLQYANCFLPWILFSFVTAIPCYAVLVLGWQIAKSISDDKAFVMKNSAKLRVIAFLALATSVYLFAGSTIFFVMNMLHFTVFVCTLLITFIGVAISVAAAVLSFLVQKAAKLQEDSDLTI